MRNGHATLLCRFARSKPDAYHASVSSVRTGEDDYGHTCGVQSGAVYSQDQLTPAGRWFRAAAAGVSDNPQSVEILGCPLHTPSARWAWQKEAGFGSPWLSLAAATAAAAGLSLPWVAQCEPSQQVGWDCQTWCLLQYAVS